MKNESYPFGFVMLSDDFMTFIALYIEYTYIYLYIYLY